MNSNNLLVTQKNVEIGQLACFQKLTLKTEASQTEDTSQSRQIYTEKGSFETQTFEQVNFLSTDNNQLLFSK
jgi:hypothetical protein